jgi:hypothetical protein
MEIDGQCYVYSDIQIMLKNYPTTYLSQVADALRYPIAIPASWSAYRLSLGLNYQIQIVIWI